MGSVLDSVARGSRVAVIRLRSLGDCVLTTPALHLLKRFRPDLRVAVAVEDRFRAVFSGNPDIEALLEPTIGAVRAWRPALCWNLHGGTRSAWMTALSGARLRAGFGHFQFPFVYNRRIPRAQEILGEERKVHTAEHLASAVFWLGAPVSGIPRARLFATAARRSGVAAEGRGESSANGRPEPATNGRGEASANGHGVAVIHAVAAAPEKTWAADGFLAVARHLHAGGHEPVFIGGPGDGLSPFSEFRCLSGASLEEVKSLLAGASLFVGNDSGPAHMAAAFGVPSVVLFGPSDPVIWAPWRTPAQVLTGTAGIGSIGVAEVLAAIERLGVPA